MYAREAVRGRCTQKKLKICHVCPKTKQTNKQSQSLHIYPVLDELGLPSVNKYNQGYNVWPVFTQSNKEITSLEYYCILTSYRQTNRPKKKKKEKNPHQEQHPFSPDQMSVFLFLSLSCFDGIYGPYWRLDTMVNGIFDPRGLSLATSVLSPLLSCWRWKTGGSRAQCDMSHQDHDCQIWHWHLTQIL